MSREKQGRAEIATASAQNRTDCLEDLEVVRRRLRVAEDLIRALSGKLLDRHEDLRRLRAVATELRGLAV